MRSFQIELQVRDYECDMQGIVNNAVYQHYFEHARHQFLQYKGLNFVEMTKSSIYFVVYKAEIEYFSPLTSNQKFFVTVEFERLSKLKGLFIQKITMSENIITCGKFYVTTIDSNKKPINLDNINIKNLY